MKINKTYLEQIIKEELEALQEVYEEEGYEEEGFFKNIAKGAGSFAKSLGGEKSAEDIEYEKKHGTGALAKKNLGKAWQAGKSAYRKSADEPEEEFLTPMMNKIQKSATDLPFKFATKVGEKFGSFSNKGVEAQNIEKKIRSTLGELDVKLQKYAQKYGPLNIIDADEVGRSLENAFRKSIYHFKKALKKAAKESEQTEE